jgi:hypothetical protein
MPYYLQKTRRGKPLKGFTLFEVFMSAIEKSHSYMNTAKPYRAFN